MLKICLCSDNHGDRNSIQKILSDNPSCDYYFHAGDSMLEESDIAPFISVDGNNDWQYDYPKERIFEIGSHRILLMHGHHYTYSDNLLADKTKENKCDVLFYGHTHIFADKTVKGIRMINPGSSYYNRDLSSPCYARVYLLEDGNIRVERIDL
ncbi:MAG: YfcE family phosphodiesterase [Erysipelotrichaceae bacterium]|nr:YfcE family phosphodiesterase [Erysipelotrichaceae bacterium]